MTSLPLLVFHNNVLIQRMTEGNKNMLVMRGKNNVFNVNLKDVALTYFVGVHGEQERSKSPESFQQLLR